MNFKHVLPGNSMEIYLSDEYYDFHHIRSIFCGCGFED